MIEILNFKFNIGIFVLHCDLMMDELLVVQMGFIALGVRLYKDHKTIEVVVACLLFAICHWTYTAIFNGQLAI
ncbi:hypothetical protein LXA26_18420, partial [Erwinia amylovora]|uniref:hypothetical protein n=1 Tax=Erwinia amylovora TaxID=552 RepID=UPI0020BE2790